MHLVEKRYTIVCSLAAVGPVRRPTHANASGLSKGVHVKVGATFDEESHLVDDIESILVEGHD